MKNSNQLISIVIPYYKKRKYILKTMKSILRQNYKNIEIILVYDDDNKKDLNFLLKLIKFFKKKKIILNKKNYGVSKSRNIALKYCKGEYIAFIDADDTWHKNKLRYQYEFMKRKSALFSFTSYNIINQKNEIIKKRIVDKDPDYSSLSKSNFIGLSTVMFHKKLISKIKFPKLKTQEDFAVWLKLLRNGQKLYHFKKILTNWRRTQHSLSSNTFNKIKDAFKLFYIYENKNLIFSVYSVIILSFNKLKN
jgi:teichuronic acid biosynthesis glycosyltransferase TuaG